MCRTNIASNTAFRGFGGPQSMLVVEEWITRVAAVLKLDPEKVKNSTCLRRYVKCIYAFLVFFIECQS